MNTVIITTVLGVTAKLLSNKKFTDELRQYKASIIPESVSINKNLADFRVMSSDNEVDCSELVKEWDYAVSAGTQM